MTIRWPKAWVVALALLVALAGSLASCAEPTAITVVVTTDFGCGDLHDVTLSVGTLGSVLEAAPPATVSRTCADGYAGRLVIVPSDAKDDLVAFKIIGGFGRTKDAEACVAIYDAAGKPSYGGGCIVARRSLRYTRHSTLKVPVVLRAACAGVACGETETCVSGACVSATIQDTSPCQDADGCDETSVLGGPHGGDGGVAAVGLLDLTTSAGPLSPAFTGDRNAYGVVASVRTLGTPLTVTPTLAPGFTATVNGAPVTSGVPSPATALGLETATPIDVAVTGGGATTHYAIVVSPLQEAYVKASDAKREMGFGTALAISGDTLVVGASAAAGPNGEVGAGAVYVFTRTGTTWSEQSILRAPNLRAKAAFGGAVALDGDKLAIGSTSESSAAVGVDGDMGDSGIVIGAAYVFVRSGAEWRFRSYLKPPDAQQNTRFGAALALSGDTLAVGAPWEGTVFSSGAVHVFVTAGASWLQQMKLKASTVRPTALFGGAVAIDGDTLAVGSIRESSAAVGVGGDQGDTGAPAAGAAYVFHRTGTSWQQTTYVKPSNTQKYASFGWSVALSKGTLVVGSSGESGAARDVDGDATPSDSMTNAGAAYVFVEGGGSWQQQAYLKASNTGADFKFGVAVAVSGDVIAVGSEGESGGARGVNGDPATGAANLAGAVYLFARTGTSWRPQAYVKASNTAEAQAFGRFVALSRDTLVVGAPTESGGSRGINGSAGAGLQSSGAVYILR